MRACVHAGEKGWLPAAAHSMPHSSLDNGSGYKEAQEVEPGGIGVAEERERGDVKGEPPEQHGV